MTQEKKRPKLGPPAILMAVLLGSLISASSVLCLVTAFSLPCRTSVILLGCLIFSLVTSLIIAAKPVVPLSLTVLGLSLIALFLLRDPLLDGAQTALSCISASYHQCYDFVPILGRPGGDCTLFLLALALPLCWLTTFVVCRWVISCFWVLLACLPSLILCLVIVDVAPVFWLTMLTASLLLLLMTNSVRITAPNEGGRLGWWLLLPTIILVAVITVLWPPAAYERATWSDTLQTFAEAKLHLEQLGTTVLYEGPRWSPELKEVDLQHLGPKVNTGREALRYRTSKPISYLRGVSLGVYEGNAWKAVPQSTFLAQTFGIPPLMAEATRLDDISLATAEIQTVLPQPVLYAPYYWDDIPSQGQAVDDAYVKNLAGVKSYCVTYRTGAAVRTLNRRDYDVYAKAQYLQLPQDLRGELEAILLEAGLTASSPAAIADYVKNLAEYDLDTPAIPSGEDFALYFLTESHRGYCVHFATATTLLLRAAGFPARYVTGYAVSGASETWNTVTEDDAHAWVEYYTAGSGWQPLDPTPIANRPQADPVPPEQPEHPPADKPEKPEVPDTPEPKPQTPKPETNKPQGSASAEETQVKLPLWLLLLPILFLLVFLRRALILVRRRDRCTKSDPNRQALTLWHWLCRLSKADGTPLPESLLSLAEKAKFSQHTLDQEELEQLRTERDSRIQALKQTSLPKKLWHRYGTVLY